MDIPLFCIILLSASGALRKVFRLEEGKADGGAKIKLIIPLRPLVKMPHIPYT
jgi:hypothetical protein